MAVSYFVNINIMISKLMISFIVLSLLTSVAGRIHHLNLENDDRSRITLSNFGYLKDGTLTVNISLFSYTPRRSVKPKDFGFTLDKSRSPDLGRYIESNTNGKCLWENPEKTLNAVFIKFDLENDRLVIERKGSQVKNLKISSQPRRVYLYENHLHNEIHLEDEEDDTEIKKPESKPVVNNKVSGNKGENVGSKDLKSGEKKQEDKTNNDLAKDKKTEDENKNPPAKGKLTENEVKNPLPKEKVVGKNTEKSSNEKIGNPVVTEKGAETEERKQPGNARKRRAPNKADKNSVTTGASSISKKEKADKDSEPPVLHFPMKKKLVDGVNVWSAYFLIHIREESETGLYNLIFHKCYSEPHSHINLSLTIVEDNNGNFLSAGEMPVPTIYFVCSVVYFILFCAWFKVLRKAEEGVYRIHHLMLVVIFFKSISCLFHGINLYMIQKTGIHVDAWAILWYIVYLMRGAFMFVTVLLIGAGWAFIKHVFSDKEKKLFLIIIPLQIFENVAWVIVEESEEGNSSYDMWHKLFIAVDLFCCFTILFPVIWSIRHLQEASRTDGKAAINLNKLKLFRHFYFLVVCYIYFTRIIQYLLKITLPFKYGWLKDFFVESFLLVFFTLVGYKFRPMSDNPYLQVPTDSDDEDIEMDEVLTKTGETETVVRVNQRGTNQTSSIKQRESSHEYD